jgi:hypothetical protein
MQKIFAKLFNRDRKFNLLDVAAPKPSKSVARALEEILKKAHDDQQIIIQKADQIHK